MPCHATHMMKEIVLPPTVRRRDPIFHVPTLLSASTPKPRRWLTMPGDLSLMLSFSGSWIVLHARREDGSLTRTGMLSFLTGPRLSVLLHLFIR